MGALSFRDREPGLAARLGCGTTILFSFAEAVPLLRRRHASYIL